MRLLTARKLLMTSKLHHEDSMLEIVYTLETIAVGQSGYLDRLCKLKVLCYTTSNSKMAVSTY